MAVYLVHLIDEAVSESVDFGLKLDQRTGLEVVGQETTSDVVVE